MWKRDQAVTPTSVDPSAAPGTSRPPVEKMVLNVGTSMTIKGELSASEDMTLCGQMDGLVRLPNHTLTIGPGADIRAEIDAKAVVVMGAVTGQVTARDKVEIHSTGSVTGDIVSPRLAIADGGYLNGRVLGPAPVQPHGR